MSIQKRRFAVLRASLLAIAPLSVLAAAGCGGSKGQQVSSTPTVLPASVALPTSTPPSSDSTNVDSVDPNSNSASSGTVRLSVDWSPLTRASALSQSNSLVISIIASSDAELGRGRQTDTDTDDTTDTGDPGAVITKLVIVNRPDQSALLENIPEGPAVIRIEGYSEPNGEGDLTGEGQEEITVVKDTTTNVNVLLASVETPTTGSGTGSVSVTVGETQPVIAPPTSEPLQTRITIGISPDKTYKRGEKAVIAAKLYSPDGNIPISNKPVRIYYTYQNPNTVDGQEQRYRKLIIAANTDANGKVLVPWRIPTDPQWHIYLELHFDGDTSFQKHSEVSKRISIGQ